MLLGLGGESESMKMKTGKLFYNISERTVQVESYDLSKDYYEFIKEAQGKNCRQVIITSDIMIQLAEFLLTEGNSTITSISFFVEDADLQDEIDQIVSCLSNNPAYWGVLKTRLDFLRKAVLDAIHKQHIHQLKQRMAAGELWDNSFDLVFTNDFGRPLNRRTVYKHLKRVLRDCGMGDYTFHSLRHSFATISLENGDDIKTVQTNLGHYAASFTLKTYVHVSDQMQRNSAARMQELIASLPRAK